MIKYSIVCCVSGFQYFTDESSMLSEESSFWGDDREHCLSDDNCWNEIPSTKVLEQLSQELSNRGSQKSEVQLRYLCH